jgi:hypothetical protein
VAFRFDDHLEMGGVGRGDQKALDAGSSTA